MGISLPAINELTPDQRKSYDLFPCNLSRGLVLTKGSTKPYLSYGLSFRQGYISAEVRELVILRVGVRTGAEYEIFYHKPEALKVGVTSEVIEQVLTLKTSFASDSLTALIKFVDNLIEGIQGKAADTDAVSKYYSDNEIAEIILLCGHYVMTAMFIKTIGIFPDENLAPSDILDQATTALHES